MIIIAAIGLICLIGTVIATLFSAEKVRDVNVEARGEISSEQLPDFTSIRFSSLHEVYFNDSFPGIKIVVDPTVTTPQLSAPAEVLPFIDFDMADGELKLTLEPDSTVYPEAKKVYTVFHLVSEAPITVITGSMPMEIENQCNLTLTLAGVIDSDSVPVVSTRGNLTLADCRIARLEISGKNAGRYSNPVLKLTGSACIDSLTVTDMTSLRLTTATDASIRSMTWHGQKDWKNEITINEGKIGKFEFIPAENSSFRIITSSNLTGSFAAQ